MKLLFISIAVLLIVGCSHKKEEASVSNSVVTNSIAPSLERDLTPYIKPKPIKL